MHLSLLQKHASHFGDMLAISDPEARTLWLKFVKSASAVALGDDYSVRDLMKHDAAPFKEVYAQYTVALYHKTKNNDWLFWAHQNKFIEASSPSFHDPVMFKSAQYDDVISVYAEKNLLIQCLNTSRVDQGDLVPYFEYLDEMMKAGYVTPQTHLPSRQFGPAPLPLLSLLHQWPEAIQEKLVLGRWDKKGLDICLALMMANNLLPSSAYCAEAAMHLSKDLGVFKEIGKKMTRKILSLLNCAWCFLGIILPRQAIRTFKIFWARLPQKHFGTLVCFYARRTEFPPTQQVFFRVT